jgi:glycyl-tRNA synthetase beta chain
MNTLLLEIGTEEIPAGYITPALKELAVRLLKRLDEHRISHGSALTYGTPRRLAVMIADVASKQTSVTNQVLGPPEKVAFDEKGNPLVPAVKFAEKLGIGMSRISVKETDKGRYLSATVTEKGLPSRTVLKTLLPEVILSIPFPKSMRWGCLPISFARPIQSILALLGKDVVSFDLGNLKSGRLTFGHRFTHPGKIKISNPEEYVDRLKQADVLCDVENRKNLIQGEIQKAAGDVHGVLLSDDELLDIVTNLVEFPAVADGRFDDKFLKLPDEILITSMREHQKYFAVTDGKGKLIPHFIVVNNTPAKDMNLVVKGHERVLRARLTDAMFFFDNDLSAPLEDNVEKLKGVLFHAKLGSMFDKTLRIRKLSEYIADRTTIGNEDADVKDCVSRAAFLCKADLVSHVVVEFPKLQGVMGRVYAGKSNEPENVPEAIEEHYRPTYSGAELPKTIAGAVVAIADKMDSICGCFSAGLIPSGASDPYALRRQGIGIVLILIEKGFSFSLSGLIKKSLDLYMPGETEKLHAVALQVQSFLKDRMANILADKGFARDVIAAVTDVSVDCVTDLFKKVEALDQLKQAPDFEPLAVAFKRVVNIIKKSGPDIHKGRSVSVNSDLFEHPCEAELLAAVKDVALSVSSSLEGGRFDLALLTIASLRKPVDAFFDGVLVMAENENLKNNRLALLGMIAALFENLADFSKLST